MSNIDEYLQKQARWENEMDGTLSGADCAVCHNKGYVAIVRDREIVHRDCECMAKRRSVWRIQRSGLSELLERYTFDAYQTPERWQQLAKAKAKQFISDHNGKWFVASGISGSGKTHLCTAICGELMESGFDTRYMLWRSESVKLKAAVTDPEEYYELIEPLKTVPVLYIDDFFKAGKDQRTGKLKITEGDTHLAFDILNARYNDTSKITILSTELSVSEIMDVDMAVGSRIYERSKEYCIYVRGENNNWRIQH